MTDTTLDFKDGGSFEFTALLDRVEIKPSKNGSYAAGTMSTRDGSIGFKKWATASLPDGVYHVRGEYQTHNGMNGVIISTADSMPDTIDQNEYRYSPYDGDALDDDVHVFVRSLSPKAQQLFKIILRGRADATTGGSVPAPVDGTVDTARDLTSAFKNEYAAIWHHDAYPHGLLAHSLKVARLARLVVEDPLYSELYGFSQDSKDVIIVGALLHDLGKTLEYDDGRISHIGRMVSHRTLMCERLALLKEPITRLYGEDQYWVLESIFAQHHGKYEETPRTVEAYVVHLVDSLDSQLTDLNELLRSTDENSQVRIRESASSMTLLSPGSTVDDGDADNDWDAPTGSIVSNVATGGTSEPSDERSDAVGVSTSAGSSFDGIDPPLMSDAAGSDANDAAGNSKDDADSSTIDDEFGIGGDNDIF